MRNDLVDTEAELDFLAELIDGEAVLLLEAGKRQLDLG